MKSLLAFVLCCCLAGSAQGQTAASLPVDGTTHLIAYTGTERVAGTSRADLLARARAWASSKSTAAKPPVVAAEQEADVVVVSSAEPLVFSDHALAVAQPLRYTLTISLQAGRYQYHLTDFALEASDPATPPHKYLPAETALLQTPTSEAAAAYLYRVRTGFEEATAALLGSLKFALANPLTPEGEGN